MTTTHKIYVYHQHCKLAHQVVTESALSRLISEDESGKEVVSDDIYLWGEGTEKQLVERARDDYKSMAKHVYLPAFNVLAMFGR